MPHETPVKYLMAVNLCNHKVLGLNASNQIPTVKLKVHSTWVDLFRISRQQLVFVISIDKAAACKHRMSRRMQAVNAWHNKKNKFIFDILEQ